MGIMINLAGKYKRETQNKEEGGKVELRKR